MRTRFVATATALLDEREDVAVVVADIGVDRFAATGASERHPDRVLNVGIREQLLVSVAGGLALEGMRPIAHTYAPFLVERGFEQVKLDLVHQDVGAVLVSVGASYDDSESGRTHHAPGDVALLATLPGFEIHVPGHPDEVETILRRTVAGTGRAYLRLSLERNAEPHGDGSFRVVRQGPAGAPVVLAIGPTLDEVLIATGELDVTVAYAATVRPFPATALRELVTGTDVVLVEPYLAGTSAAELAAALSGSPHRLLTLGIREPELRRYGSPADHRRAHGLDADGLRRAIDDFLRPGS